MVRTPDTKPADESASDTPEGTQVTYDPPADDAEQVTWRGQLFEKGKAVLISDPEFVAAVKNNPFFKVAKAVAGRIKDKD